LGIGYWGLTIGPNPQSTIPNPQSPIPKVKRKIIIINYNKNLLIHNFKILNIFNYNKNK